MIRFTNDFGQTIFNCTAKPIHSPGTPWRNAVITINYNGNNIDKYYTDKTPEEYYKQLEQICQDLGHTYEIILD